MKLYSTNKISPHVQLREAILNGQAPDGGLYMPENIPSLSPEVISSFSSLSFNEIAFTVSKAIFKDELSDEDLKSIIDSAFDFEAPLHELNEKLYSLELFHGPTLAFKDFGARFMARLMGHYVKNEDKELTILVATSGDTGSAVASAFYKVPGIKVKILYPKGKVSHLQELQLTTWGDNISALEVDGTFDDCQKLVKQAFSDTDLREKLWISSANSINIARLIPQSFYYFFSFSRLAKQNISYCVPSGNFGNITAGLIAKKMGLPIKSFIAATNANDVVPQYLQTGTFTPRPSVQTISNAMDVGNPSNLSRMQDIYNNVFEDLKAEIHPYSYSDEDTKKAIKEVKEEYNYTLDPHGAVAYLAAKEHQLTHDDHIVFLETAHPAKFIETVEDVLESKLELPKALKEVSTKTKVSTEIKADYQELLSNLI